LLQVFARKIVRVFGLVTTEDVEREAGIVSELCKPGQTVTAVEVIDHGWLPRNPSYYYIDMEYCPETLERRIHSPFRGNDSQLSMMNGKLAPPSVKVSLANPDPNLAMPVSASESTSVELASPSDDVGRKYIIDWESIVDVIREINDGLLYIHSHKVVHRDLKPSNGTSLQYLFDCSAFLRERQAMETL
jgi:serine/threonine protein kinase